jgi:hypothetical protein
MKRTGQVLLIFTLICTAVFAQTNEETDKSSTWKMVGNAQYVTQHHWRGLGRGPLFGEAPAFEPSISFFNKNWNVGVVAGGSFDGVYKVVMPWISFSPVKNLWIGVWDIYSPGKKLWTNQAKPFDFGLTTSNHFVDAMIFYQLPWLSTHVEMGDNSYGKRPEYRRKKKFHHIYRAFVRASLE